MMTLRRSASPDGNAFKAAASGCACAPRAVSPSRLDAPVREGRAVARSVAGPVSHAFAVGTGQPSSALCD
jgi:hypothetical protein